MVNRCQLAYDLCLIVTSFAMAVLAADRTSIPYRWTIVYTTGVASVVWRSWRAWCNIRDRKADYDHPLFAQDFVLSTLCTLGAWVLVSNTRHVITSVIAVFVFGFTVEAIGYLRMSYIIHAIAHILVVITLASFN